MSRLSRLNKVTAKLEATMRGRGNLDAPLMHLACCTNPASPPGVPRGAVYIGRAMGGRKPLLGSPLANPFGIVDKGREDTTSFVVVDDPIESYKRHLTKSVLQWQGDGTCYAELRKLVHGCTLACWCVDRPAVLLRHGDAMPERLCHGDVVFTVFVALQGLGWNVQLVDFMRDYDGATKAWAALYHRAFGEWMRYRNGRLTTEGMRGESDGLAMGGCR